MEVIVSNFHFSPQMPPKVTENQLQHTHGGKIAKSSRKDPSPMNLHFFLFKVISYTSPGPGVPHATLLGFRVVE